VTVAVLAVAVGIDSNLTAGATVSLITAIAGVDGTATVATGGLTDGTDNEALEAWRARLLMRIQEPPQGGSTSDYEQWAKSVSGVTRAWVYPMRRGLGTVDVCFVIDGRSNIIPLTADVTAVQTSIDAARPVTDDCVVFAPVAQALPLTLSSLIPNNSDTRAAVQAAWADLLTTDAIPGGGLSFQDQIIPAIAGSAGVIGFVISSPSSDVYGIAGKLYTPGNVTFPG
jgi:uncharacterized phage protein gp47/JayE